MQFGIGLLGKGWTLEQQHEVMRTGTRPARENFPAHADRYVAKIAAETILANVPILPDLSDEGIISRLGNCAILPRRSEFQMIRDAWASTYGDYKMVEAR